jgi:HEPN domain-containing protein
MNAILREWLEKADEDYTVALREARARRNPAFNAVCFHAQQCIEKYLKAALAQGSKPFQKTHDLDVLLNDCLDRFPLWEAMRDDFKRLSRYAVQFRYPGESADRDEAWLAVRTMKRCREALRATLGVEDAVPSRPRRRTERSSP